MCSGMSETSKKPGVFVLANPEKPGIERELDAVVATASRWCAVKGRSLGLDGSAAVGAGASFVIVLGGDGSLLAVCRSMGRSQLPLIGINLGKLGFLAEFTVEQLESTLGRVVSDAGCISERMILSVRVTRSGQSVFESLAVNDCVVHAGAPYRMIDLAVRVDGVGLTHALGDGLIVCTPVGSTAHNLSAGGPIMQGGVLGIALTPLAPHSLTHRPLVIEHEARVEIGVDRANEGTAVVVDGQVACGLKTGDVLAIARFESNMRLVRNPAAPRWHSLVTKLHWGQPPNYNHD